MSRVGYDFFANFDTNLEYFVEKIVYFAVVSHMSVVGLADRTEEYYTSFVDYLIVLVVVEHTHIYYMTFLNFAYTHNMDIEYFQ